MARSGLPEMKSGENPIVRGAIVNEAGTLNGRSDRLLLSNEKGPTMPLIAESDMNLIGQTRGMENHDHDLIHDLNKRLDALWRYDQYIANADGHPDLQQVWRDFKLQEQENIKRLKACVAREVEQDCF